MSQSDDLIVSAGGSSSIPPHPEGQYAATCIDLVDLGMVKTTWQGQERTKHRIFLRYFCGEFFDSEKGKAPLWLDKYFTASLHENSALRPFLEQWRGVKFSDDELKGFNVSKLLYVPAYVQVLHNRVAEKTYANIDTIMRLPRGMDAPPVPNGYVRVRDRPKDGAPSPNADSDDGPGADGLPF